MLYLVVAEDDSLVSYLVGDRKGEGKTRVLVHRAAPVFAAHAADRGVSWNGKTVHAQTSLYASVTEKSKSIWKYLECIAKYCADEAYY